MQHEKKNSSKAQHFTHGKLRPTTIFRAAYLYM